MSIWLESPIFGADEYAYLANGIHIGELQRVFKLDPALPKISNSLYLSYLKLTYLVSETHSVDINKLFHALLYVLTALVLFSLVKRVLTEKAARLGTIAFLLLPTTIYIHSLLPEIELIFMTSLVAYCFVILYSRKPILSLTMAGLFSAASLLIKPHGLITIATAVGFIFLSSVVKITPRVISKAFIDILVYTSSTFASYVLLWYVSTGSLSLNPMDALGLSFYGKLIASEKSVEWLPYFFMFLFAHLTVLYVIFNQSLIWIFESLRQRLLNCNAADPSEKPRYRLALFVLILTTLNLFMISWFSAKIMVIPTEANRLQGRYLSSTIAFLPYLHFYALGNLNVSLRFERYVKYFTALVFVLFVTVVLKHFKIFPWDYPLFFAFYTSPNFYQWNMPVGISNLGTITISLIILAWVTTLFVRRLKVPLMSLALFVVIIAGTYQSYSWVFWHTKSHEKLASIGRAVKDFTDKNSVDSGLFVTSNRHGSITYILFNYGGIPKIMVRDPQSTLSARDMGDFQWALVESHYEIDFEFLQMIDYGPFKLFDLRVDRADDENNI